MPEREAVSSDHIVELLRETGNLPVRSSMLTRDDKAEQYRRLSAGFVRTLGTLEILAAAGLILPAVLDIAPVMVPVTAVCWILLMIGAMITHARYDQYKYVALNFFYLAAAAFVARGRFGPESFTG